MKDDQIVELYWQRNADAISETANKYGAYCFTIAKNILHSTEDSEECVNDTWLHAWNAMPPQRPNVLRMFLAKIIRNLSFNRFKANSAQKRGGGEIVLVLDELAECLDGRTNVEAACESKDLYNAIGKVDDDILEKNEVAANVRKVNKRRLISGVMAACLCLVIVGAVIWKQNQPSHIKGTGITNSGSGAAIPQVDKGTGITLKYGSELYEDRLHLSDDLESMQYESHDSWFNSQEERYQMDSANDMVLDFINDMDSARFVSCDAVPLDEGQDSIADTEELYHLYFNFDQYLL